MADKKDMSNTMEINSILAEARTRKYDPEGKSKKADAAPAGVDSRAKTEKPEPSAPVRRYDADQDDFIYVDSEGKVFDSNRPVLEGDGYEKKSKKPLIITIAAIIVIIAAGIAAGILIPKLIQNTAPDLPQGEIAEDVFISGVNVGGMDAKAAKLALAPVEQKLADSINIEVTSGEKKVVLTKEDLKYSFNTDDILREVLSGDNTATSADGKNSKPSAEIKIIIDESSYKTAADKVAKEVDAAAKDAKVTSFEPDKSEMFTYQKEQPGKKLKSDDLIKKLKTLVDSGKLSGSVEAASEESKPAITEDQLRKGIKKLSSFTTESTNTWNANENMRISLASCSGSIIEPGATWSFNNCTGDSNLESNGYKPAGVIVQGRYETGIGGGICQSSTTIYNAAILSGMEIVERYCHYYPSSYVDYGRDATIDYGNIDLKLKNPFKYQMFLKCWIDGDILHAEFYGLPADDFDTIQVSTSDPSYFSSGYTVTASRTYYKDGKVVRTEALPSSTYYFSAPGGDDDSSSSSKPASSSGSASSKPASSVVSTPSDPGGEEPGGEEPGGEEPGGEEPGGEEPGGEEPGGEEPGGEEPGGEEPGGEEPGGEGEEGA